MFNVSHETCWIFCLAHTDNGIAFGITIGALTAQSCDASWIPSSTSWNLTDASFKLMELDSLSIYWNHVKKDELLSGLNLGDLAVSVNFNYPRQLYDCYIHTLIYDHNFTNVHLINIYFKPNDWYIKLIFRLP